MNENYTYMTTLTGIYLLHIYYHLSLCITSVWLEKIFTYIEYQGFCLPKRWFKGWSTLIEVWALAEDCEPWLFAASAKIKFIAFSLLVKKVELKKKNVVEN